MAATSKTTIDHPKIQRWVEERGGHPATVKRTASGTEPGILRVDFPGDSGQESLEKITWCEFFDKFEASELAFLYQEETKDGQPSRFCKLVSRTSEGRNPGARKTGKPAAAGSSAKDGKQRAAKKSAKSSVKKRSGR